MSRCEVLIDLERREPFRPGEAIRGRVLLRGERDARIRGVTLGCAWSTSGRGNRDKGGKKELVLSEELTLPDDAERAFPFELEAPAAPTSYAGKLLSIDWTLRARADIPWGRDAGADVPITIASGIPVAPHAPPEPYLRGVPVAELPRESRERLDAVPEATTRFAVLHRIAEYRLGRASLKLFASSLRPGEPLQFFIRFAPRGNIYIPSISAVLRARETVVRGSGKHRSTHHHTARELAATPAEPRHIAAGEDIVFVGRIDLPADAPCSFKASNNRVQWRLDVRVDIPGWPDWRRSAPIEVRP